MGAGADGSQPTRSVWSMSRAALAFKPLTGRAIPVMLAGDLHEARVIERSEIALLPDGEFAP